MVTISAPRIVGICSLVSSTKNSLTFIWNPATSATSYRLVRDGVDVMASSENNITVRNLQPGIRYTFTVWAVGQSPQLISNNITCGGSTGTPL